MYFCEIFPHSLSTIGHHCSWVQAEETEQKFTDSVAAQLQRISDPRHASSRVSSPSSSAFSAAVATPAKPSSSSDTSTCVRHQAS